MRLKFSHRGKQFFFLTICVRGREAVLSRLIEGAARPELTAKGACVKALWLVVHKLNAALTASEFVIMPDHVHLLLIVDYDRDPDFKPLVFLHWFMAESARMMAAMDGGSAPEPLLPTAIRKTYNPSSLGDSGATPPSVASFWEDRFWLDLSFDSRQLATIRRYIRGNPARALWKRNHPDKFICHFNLHHRILDPALPWSGCGDLTLLASPFLLAVSLTRKKTLAEHEPEIARLVGKARQGWIIVCGFLSPGEKELGRRLRVEVQTRWIKTLAQGLPPRYDPSFVDSRDLAAGRMMILSALPPNAPFDWNTCHEMNAHAAAMCRRAQGYNIIKENELCQK